jgi:hypothetical protein
MDRTIARVGSWAGLVTVVGIAGYQVTLQLLAGERVSGTVDVAAITAYYQHGSIAVLGVSQFVVLVPVVVFFVALRESTGGTSLARFFGTIALAAGIAQLPAVLVEISAQAALVVGVENGDAVVPLFRFWDVLYNSGIYVLEATWVAAFGLSMRASLGFPRWMSILSAVTATLLGINVVAIWMGIPDPATLPSAGFLVAWFIGASIGMRRLGAEARPVPVPSPA